MERKGKGTPIQAYPHPSKSMTIWKIVYAELLRIRYYYLSCQYVCQAFFGRKAGAKIGKILIRKEKDGKNLETANNQTSQKKWNWSTSMWKKNDLNTF